MVSKPLSHARRRVPGATRSGWRDRAALAAALCALVGIGACHSAPPNGSPAELALEECDPAQGIQCITPEAFTAIPVRDGGLYLTYSSNEPDGVSANRPWDAGSLGLGGWSLNAVQRYDTLRQVLFRGDGTWRITPSVALAGGGHAVPTFDGTQAYIFDAAGRHVRTVDARLGTTLLTIAYDAAGRLARVDGMLDSVPVHLGIERGPDGAPRALIGPDSGRSSLELDAHHRLIAVSDPDAGRTSIEWDSAGHVTSLTNPLGARFAYSYDADGHLAATTDPDSVTRQFERSLSGNRMEVRVTSALGRRWTYRAERTGDGLQRTFIDRDGTTTTELVDAHGTRTITLPDGTAYTVGSAPSVAWKMAAPLLTPIVERRPDGIVSRRVVTESSHAVGGAPFARADTIRTVINGQLWRQETDPVTRTIVLVDPLGRRTTTVYDSAGRTVRTSAPGRPATIYAYDALGRITGLTSGTGALARAVRLVYDARTGRITTSLPDGSIARRVVDRRGNIVQGMFGDASSGFATFDAGDRPMRVAPPGGMTFTLGTSPGGRATGFAPPVVAHDSSVETRSYDADGELARVVGPGSHTQALTYDNAWRVQRWSFDQGDRTFSYDTRSGAMTRSTDPSGVVTTYGYTGNVLDHLAWSGPVTGSVTESLDANGRPSVERVDGASVLDFGYDGAGLLTRVGPLALARDPATDLVTRTTLGVVETEQQFDADGRLVHTTTTAGGKRLLESRYAYDQLDRITRVITTSSDGSASNTEYGYDGAGRLARVRLNGRDVERDEYDPAGNRTSVARPAHAVRATYDDRDEATTWDSIGYAWSRNGMLTRAGGGGHATAFTFDDFGTLRRVLLPDGREIRYLMDADGRRVGRTVGGTLQSGFLYRPDGTIAAETDGHGAVVARFGYDDAGHLALVRRGGVDYRVVTDPRGSPLVVIDARTGAVVDAIAYDAWGRVERETAPGTVPIGFAGALRDADTGLLRMGARDYDPVAGRWTAPDPLRFAGGDANLYRYVTDDPINAVDPNGTCGPITPGSLGLGGVGVVAAAAYNTLDHLFPCAPPHNNPPPGNQPPDDGNAPDHPWQCNNPTGGCLPGGNVGCWMGNCGGDPHNFNCHAVICWGPDGKGCEAEVAGANCDWNWADPHLRAGNGFRFDLQAAGEFLMAASRNDAIEIQGRQEQWLRGADVTINTAVAARVHGDRVGVYTREPAYLVVNDVPVPELELQRTLPHGGSLERHGSLVVVRWPDGSTLTVSNVAGALNYTFLGAAGVGPMRGVLSGPEDGTPDALVARDGSVLRLTDPAFPTRLYHPLADSWRIGARESLFHYWPGESTATFNDVRVPSRRVTAASLAAPARARAAEVCRAFGVHDRQTLDDCVLDVGITGVPAFAASSAPVGDAWSATWRASLAPRPAAPDIAPGAPLASESAKTRQSSTPDQFAIAIGDTVAPGRPARGAGIITRVGQQQTYTFEGTARQVIYLAIGPCTGAQPSFDLRAPKGALVLDVIGNCHPIMQRQVLPATGTYRLVVSTIGANAASRYGFVVQRVPPDQHFAVRLPLTVGPDVPTRGAGRIAVSGAQQMFDFSAAPGSALHVEAHCPNGCEHLAIRVVPVGRETKTPSVELNYLKTDWPLPAGGRYTIEVRSDGFTGDYGFTATAHPRVR